ncbi:OLC1v1036598C1 [Oldenlandia corymbosa var. corymbosa]|uniref:OLC1v1036598C1 n=1 Tax=Oldenlandia corymbosa var. corymbosa TaxID=529605 RepID=A0AAV1CWL9_OLDCO|nr:OLC1v1036598C1 [Oldenlandia corymbosa var. corymbosa]
MAGLQYNFFPTDFFVPPQKTVAKDAATRPQQLTLPRTIDETEDVSNGQKLKLTKNLKAIPPSSSSSSVTLAPVRKRTQQAQRPEQPSASAELKQFNQNPNSLEEVESRSGGFHAGPCNWHPFLLLSSPASSRKGEGKSSFGCRRHRLIAAGVLTPTSVFDFGIVVGSNGRASQIRGRLHVRGCRLNPWMPTCPKMKAHQSEDEGARMSAKPVSIPVVNGTVWPPWSWSFCKPLSIPVVDGTVRPPRPTALLRPPWSWSSYKPVSIPVVDGTVQPPRPTALLRPPWSWSFYKSVLIPVVDGTVWPPWSWSFCKSVSIPVVDGTVRPPRPTTFLRPPRSGSFYKPVSIPVVDGTVWPLRP